ncbi:MAG: hypothetical protein H3C49_04455 [Alphaproteobacteria bacterium]|nr:hypothetical protein [Alphaproteobacteria bacterium]
MKKTMMALALMSSLALIGCGGEASADAEVERIMTEYYERPLCERFVSQPPFTIYVESPTGGDKAAIAANILAEAGILAKTDEKDAGVGHRTATFNATEKGAQIIQGNRICYGKSKMAKLLEASGPEQAMGTEVRRVKVLVSYEITEDWAKNPALAYLVLSGEHEMSHVLMKQDNVWVVAQ